MNRTTGVWKNMKFSELQNLNGGADGEVKSWFMWILNKILDQNKREAKEYMLEILENQTLEVENLVSFRGSLTQAELEEIGQDLETAVNEAGAKRVGNPMTATYGVDGNRMDIEILLPVDKKIQVTGKYTYKDRIKIVNAVVAKYVGNPAGLQEACNELNQYIMEHKLSPITVGYNVTKNINPMNMEETEIDVYVGISPNVLQWKTLIKNMGVDLRYIAVE